MKLLMLTVSLAAAMNVHASGNDAEVIAKLKDSKITMLEAIRQAEQTSGPVTSAKFEMDGNNLSLSIYTAPQGLSTPAEANDLTELAGDPTVQPFAPKAEIFKDKAHIARASVHLTLMQLSKLNLSEIILAAMNNDGNCVDGIPYSVSNPEVRQGEPVADVWFADLHDQGFKVTVNMRTAQIVR